MSRSDSKWTPYTSTAPLSGVSDVKATCGQQQCKRKDGAVQPDRCDTRQFRWCQSHERPDRERREDDREDSAQEGEPYAFGQ